MKFNMKGQKGFSLVELMVVVGIIGILASLAMPRLQVFMAKAKQAEVKTNLGTMVTLIESYKVEQNPETYVGATNATIGFNPPAAARYAYTPVPASLAVTTYTVQGSAIAGALCNGSGVDTWTRNELNVLTNTAAFGTCN